MTESANAEASKCCPFTALCSSKYFLNISWCPSHFAKVVVAATEVVEAVGAEEGGTEVVEVEGEVSIGTTAGQRSPLRRLWR